MEIPASLSGTANGPFPVHPLWQEACRDEACAALYRQFERPILQHLLRLTQNREDAADLSQHTWLKVWRHWDRCTEGGDQGRRAWVYRIAVNAWRDHRRRRVIRRTLPLQYLQDDERRHAADDLRHAQTVFDEATNDTACDPALLLSRGGEVAAVRRHLGRLSDYHRAVLVLGEYEGLDCASMAARLGKTVQAIKNARHQARAAFRRSWEADYGRVV